MGFSGQRTFGIKTGTDWLPSLQVILNWIEGCWAMDICVVRSSTPSSPPSVFRLGLYSLSLPLGQVGVPPHKAIWSLKHLELRGDHYKALQIKLIMAAWQDSAESPSFSEQHFLFCGVWTGTGLAYICLFCWYGEQIFTELSIPGTVLGVTLRRNYS